MSGKENKRIGIVVPKEMYDKLEELRKQKGKISIPELIREALGKYIEEEEERGS